MVASSFASDRKSSATARKSKTRCSRGEPTPTRLSPPVCPHLAAPAIPVPSSFTSLLGCHPEPSTLSSFGCQALVANRVCLCSSDCESREVLTLLCQGETFTNVCGHCPTRCGHSLILFHTLSSSFSCDLCGSFPVVLLCTSCLVFFDPLLNANLLCVLTLVALFFLIIIIICPLPLRLRQA